MRSPDGSSTGCGVGLATGSLTGNDVGLETGLVTGTGVGLGVGSATGLATGRGVGAGTGLGTEEPSKRPKVSKTNLKFALRSAALCTTPAGQLLSEGQPLFTIPETASINDVSEFGSNPDPSLLENSSRAV